MNKNILIIPLILLSSTAFTQTVEKTSDFSLLSIPANYLEVNTKTLKYDIVIRKENKDIFKSSFNVKNGKEFIILNKQEMTHNQKFNKKSGAVNKQEIISTMDGTEDELADLEQLKVTANIDRDENIFSQFAIKTSSVETLKKVSLLEQESKAAGMETAPTINNNQSNVMVTHLKNNETVFFMNKKEFIIKVGY